MLNGLRRRAQAIAWRQVALTDRWRFFIGGAASFAVGLLITWIGVHRSDGTPGSQAGLALVAIGTSIVGGAIIGVLIGLAQMIVDENRSAREAEEAERSALALTVNTNINLKGIDLSTFKFPGGYLPGRDFSRAELSDADFERANLTDCIFNDAQLIGTRLAGADLTSARFVGADLGGADLRGAVVDGADFAGAKADDLTQWPNGLKPPGVLEASPPPLGP